MNTKNLWIALLVVLVLVGFAYKNFKNNHKEQVEEVTYQETVIDENQPQANNNIASFVGTYELDGFLNTPEVKRATEKLNILDLTQLKNNLQVKSPIEYSDDYYWITGNKKHEGGVDMGLLSVNDKTSKFYAVITSDKEIKVITNDVDNLDSINQTVKDYVENRKNDLNLETVNFKYLG